MAEFLSFLPLEILAPVAWLVVKILAAFFFVWGALDFFIATFKFRKRDAVDKTAYLINWLFIKWENGGDNEIEKRYPYVSRDLGETVGWKQDDGDIT